MPLPEDFRGFPEPQFTRTPNLIFDVLLTDLTGSQLKTLLLIVRKTMGWGRDHRFYPISISDIQAGANLSRESVVDAIKFLCDRKLVLRNKSRGEEGRQGITTYRLRFETDPDAEEIPESEKLTLDEISRVGKVDVNLDSGTGAYNKVLKDIKEKDIPPLPPSQENQLQTQTHPGYSDVDPETGAPIKESLPRKRQWSRKREKVEDPNSRSCQLRRFREAQDYVNVSREVSSQPPSPLLTQPAQPQPLPQAALDWNRIVTSGPPVEEWTARDRALPVCDQDFLAALPKVLPLCQKAFQVQGDEASWLNFRWLLRNSHTSGVVNWYRMATGEFAWLGKKRNGNVSKSQQQADFIEEEIRRTNEQLAEYDRLERLNRAGTTHPA